MIPPKNPFVSALTALFSSRKFSRRGQTARRRLAALRTVTARQRFGLASRAAALFGASAVILLGSQSKSSAQATVPADTQYQYQNSTGNFSTGFTPALGAGSTTAELNFSGTGPYTATDDIAALTVNDLSFFNAGLVSIVSGTAGNTITLAGTTPSIYATNGSSALIDTILAGTAGLTKLGLGTVTLGAAETYTGTTAVNAGTLSLDFTQSTAPATNLIAATSVLSLGGGTLNILGATGGSSQTFASTTLNVGGNGISLAPTAGGANPTLALGALTLTKGTSVVFNGPTTKGASNATVAATGTITTTTAGGGPVGLVGTTGVNGTGAIATVGLYDWASTDTAAGTAGTSPYTIIGGSQVTGFYQTTGITTAGNLDVVTGSVTTLGNATGSSTVRFNSPTALSLTFSATTANGIQGFLVTPNIGANNVTIGPAADGVEFIRSTSGGSDYGVVWQNNTLGFLNFNAEINGGRQAGQNNGLAQAGIGTVNYSGSTNGNFYELATYLNGGYSVYTADNQLGNPATASAVNLGGGTIFANTTFTLDNAGANARPVTLLPSGGDLSAVAGATFTVDGLVTGTGPLTIGLGTLPGSGAGTANTTALVGSGTVILSNTANTYSGGTFLNAGTLRLTGVIGQLGTGGVTFNGGTFQYGSGATADISARTVTFASGGGTIDTNSNNVTFANSIGNGGAGGLTKVGLGTLTLSSANIYSGATVVNAGSLLINNTTGSGTGTGNVTVNSGGTFGGAGTSTGTTTVNSGGFLSSNNSTVATLTLGNLTLSDGSTTNIGFSTSANSSVTVTGTLSLNGTDKINLLQIGTTSTFATAGTYTLFTDGTLTGSVGSLSVANPAANTNYAFNVVGNTIQLTISGGLVNSAWNVDANGNYSVAGNWTNGVPNTSGAQAVFGSVITAPRTVTVDGTFTVGEIDFNNVNAYTLTPAAAGNGFVFNNGTSNAVINDINGSHTEGAPIAMGLGANVNVANATDTLTISGAISNTGAAGTGTLSKTGAGTLALLGANSYDGGVTITQGTVQINSGSSLGAMTGTAALNSSSFAVTLEALNSITSARNFTLTGATNNFQVDGAANTYEIDGTIVDGASAGTLIKTGVGTLALGGNDTFTGGTTISAGTLSLGSGGTAGSVAGNIVDNAALVLNRTDTYNLGNVISGTGTLTQTGSGNTTLTAANTFSGTTTVSAGTLTLGNALALQNSTLNNTTTGTLSFGTLTAATLSGLTGTGTLVLTNTAAAGVTLTLGNNNATSSFAGTLSGVGGVGKIGSGTVTLAGTGGAGATYTGNTTIYQGTLVLGGTTNISGASSTGNIDLTGALGTTSLLGSLTVQDNAVINTTGFLRLSSNDGQNTNNFAGATTLLVKNAASLTVGSFSFGNVSRVPAGVSATIQDTASLTVNGAFNLESTEGGTASNNAVNLNGGTLAVNSFTYSGGNGTSQLATLNFNGGVLSPTATNATFFPALTGVTAKILAGGLPVNTNGFNVTIGQALTSGVANDGGLTKLGAGTLTLTGANSYLGLTTITGGTLNINGQFALGGGNYAGTTFNGGTLQYANPFPGTNGTTDISQNSGGTPKPVTFTQTATIDTNGNAVTYANPVGNGGAGGLTVTSTTAGGSLTLAGANTYTGATTVSSGSLFVNGSVGAVGTPSGAVTVASGATLGGAGTLTVASASVAGTLAPGATAGATTGALTLSTTSGLTLSGTLVISLNSTGGVSSGTVLNTGALTLTGASLSLTGSAADGTTTYDLVNYTGTLGGDGAFANANVPAGYTINYAGTTFAASDIELDPMSAVPEPSTWLAGFLLVGAVGYKRRKQIGSLFAA